MGSKKTAAKKPAAAKPVAKPEAEEKAVGSAGEAPETAAASKPEAEVAAPTYSKADKVKIKKLTEAEVELTGTESPEELDTLVAALDLEEGGVQTEAEEKPGVPNVLPVRTETINLGGKEYKMGIFFVAAVKGGFALYDYQGKRVSPAYNEESVLAGETKATALQYINKASARFNAQRRHSFMPGDAVN